MVPERHAEKAKGLAAPDNASDWLDKLTRCALKLLDGDGIILVLHGSRGTGKTQLAVCLIREFCIHLKRARYIKAMDLYLSIRESFGKDGESEREVVESFIGEYNNPLALLVIDEVHVRGHSEWEDRVLTHIIDRRYESKLDTVLITNETEEQAIKSLGASITDRVRETGAFVACDWSSYRAR